MPPYIIVTINDTKLIIIRQELTIHLKAYTVYVIISNEQIDIKRMK